LLTDLFSDRAKMEMVFRKYQIDYLLMSPRELDGFKKLLLTDPEISSNMRLLYENEGFGIASVRQGNV